ncbi:MULTISPECIES: hypothetical protein [Shewanella]|uniref:hypothetical protein n=1 Tax=Shewanella TaxID=22 RepID=UPI003AB108F9
MSRRYLTKTEAEFALRRGKTVEVFLGGFKVENDKCIRWATFTLSGSGVKGNLWEAFDQGSVEYCDIYTFDSPNGEYDEPVKTVISVDIEMAAKELGIIDQKFVNQGMAESEYIAYIESST